MGETATNTGMSGVGGTLPDYCKGITIDLVAPLVSTGGHGGRGGFPFAIEQYREGRVDVIGATVVSAGGMAGGVGGQQSRFQDSVDNVLKIVKQIETHSELALITQVRDFEESRDSGRLGIILHFQTATPLERSVDYVSLFHQLGVRMIGLALNVRNFIGDGCMEPANGGLSRFGRSVVKAMNTVGIAVDGSHVGERTSLDAMAIAEAPFLFTHSGCKAVYEHPRNITDEQIRECAGTGGVVGIVGTPFILGEGPGVGLETLIRHIVHAVEVAGVDHVGIGIDFDRPASPWSSLEEQQMFYDDLMTKNFLEPGAWPPPPWVFPVKTPAEMPLLEAGLLEHGFSSEETAKIMGENFARVLKQIWGG